MFSKITIQEAIKAANGSTYYETVEKELQGYYWAYWYTSGGNIYYTKREYEKTTFRFVYVKIKNDATISIKNGNTETTYSGTRYQIVNF